MKDRPPTDRESIESNPAAKVAAAGQRQKNIIISIVSMLVFVAVALAIAGLFGDDEAHDPLPSKSVAVPWQHVE